MAGPKVQFKIATRAGGKFTSPVEKYSSATADLFKPSYSTGQIIFVEDEGNIYLDFHNYRKCYTKGEGADPSNVRYLGVADEDPSLNPTSPVKINGKTITPRPNDMVAFGTKEFLWREDKGRAGTFRWFEVGDEDAPEWDDEDDSWGDEG